MSDRVLSKIRKVRLNPQDGKNISNRLKTVFKKCAESHVGYQSELRRKNKDVRDTDIDARFGVIFQHAGKTLVYNSHGAGCSMRDWMLSALQSADGEDVSLDDFYNAGSYDRVMDQADKFAMRDTIGGSRLREGSESSYITTGSLFGEAVESSCDSIDFAESLQFPSALIQSSPCQRSTANTPARSISDTPARSSANTPAPEETASVARQSRPTIEPKVLAGAHHLLRFSGRQRSET